MHQYRAAGKEIELMAAKGDRAVLEPQARLMFGDGKAISEISKTLGISENSLYRWKSESRIPGEDMDGWEKDRFQKRSVAERIRALFLRELKAAEDSTAGSINASIGDTLQKLGSLAVRWEEVERNSSGGSLNIDRPKIFLENLEWIARALQETDPEGLKILARNFDQLTVKFKAEYLNA
jgi:transposase-like protein